MNQQWLLSLSLILGLLRAAHGSEPVSDVQREQQALDHLFQEVLPVVTHHTRLHPNTQEPVLEEIVFFEGEQRVEEETFFPIPLESSLHAGRFTFIEIRGEGLRGITWIGYQGLEGGFKHLGTSERTVRMLRIPRNQLRRLTRGSDAIVLRGSGTVHRISMYSAEGIQPHVPEDVFTTPGADRPRREITLRVDATRGLSLGGVEELPVENFFRLYFAPDQDQSGLEPYFAERGFLPGRQILKFRPTFETRHGTRKPPLLQEDPERPGHADLSFFEQLSFDRFREVDPNLQFAQCLDDWPTFMEVEIPGVRNDRGTPAVEHFDAAAELAAAAIAAEVRDSGRTATWWEVKNESDIQYEWSYHWTGADSWGKLADFHNKVATAIKETAPEVKVGGPSSAWPQMQAGSPAFSTWGAHRRFMDLTRGALDFYSHHFYEGQAMDTYAARRTENGYRGWLHGRLECVLDMVLAHMQATDNVRPILVTEYGSLLGGLRHVDYSIRVNNYSSLMMRFMQRPGEIALAVPFLLGYMHWLPEGAPALVHRDEDGEFYLTPNQMWLDLWEGVRGYYMPIESPDRNVHAMAWRNEEGYIVAINNVGPDRLAAHIDWLLPEAVELIEGTYRTPTYRDGMLIFETTTLKPDSMIPVGRGETVIVFAPTASAPPAPAVVLDEQAFYANDTALVAGDGVELLITIPSFDPDRPLDSARLRIGLSAPNGVQGELTGRFNGESISADLSFGEGVNEFFEWVEIPIDPAWLKEENHLTLHVPVVDAVISHARLTCVFSRSTAQ